MLSKSFAVKGMSKFTYVFYLQIAYSQKIIPVVSDGEAILDKKKGVGTFPVAYVDLVVFSEFEIPIR